MKYRKKPVEIEAVQFTENNKKEVLAFLGYIPSIDYIPEDTTTQERFSDYLYDLTRDGIMIKTLEGDMKASLGDYIIKGVNGEFYPCKPDIFLKTYEEVTLETALNDLRMR